jgi:hypothetical protein
MIGPTLKPTIGPVFGKRGTLQGRDYTFLGGKSNATA